MTDSPSGLERLELADWRRRVSDLYGSVRAEAEDDPESAWEIWRDERQRLFRTHPQSPVPAVDRSAFRARHWPYDPRLRFEVPLDTSAEAPGLPGPFSAGLSLALPISTGGEEAFTRIGRLAIPFRGGRRTLGIFWMAGYAGGIFVPFRDATNGTETYGAGRYLLDTAKSADLGPGAARASLILDFNFAFHPSCAFDPQWSCPLAPPENRLDIRIEAGERLT
jgi:uncharacterized protein (DUF1684 family)